MSPPPPPPPPPPPAPPPRDQDYYTARQTPSNQLGSPYGWQPGWPKVISIIAILVAAWGIVVGGGSNLMGNQMLSVSSQQFERIGINDEWLVKLRRVSLINGIGCVILGALLLAGGIALLRLRRVSRSLLLIWAVLRIGLAAATAPLVMDYTRAMVDGVVNAMPAPAPADGSSPPSPSTVPTSEAVRFAAGVGSVLSAGVSVVMPCAMPLFVLVWFNLRKVREYTATLP